MKVIALIVVGIIIYFFLGGLFAALTRNYFDRVFNVEAIGVRSNQTL